MDNLPNNKDEPDPEEDSLSEGRIQTLFMNELERYANELIYIPGNHDPSTLFKEPRDERPLLCSNVEGNIHKSAIKLRENLVIIGLGGCVQDFV